jgi:hypothetical protein
MVAWLYLTLAYVTLAFSLPLTHYGYNSRLQLLVYSNISLLSSSQHHHSKLNHFRIQSVDNEFEKTI